MKFAKYSGSLSYDECEFASKKLTQLFLELGTRKDNPHVGSGLGGNNIQLVVLLGMKHILTSESIGIDVTNSGVVWGIDYLRNVTLVQLRTDLDMVFEDEVGESRKYIALAFQSLSENMVQVLIQEYKLFFPNIELVLNQKDYEGIDRLATHEQLIMAYILCIRFAKELDNGNMSNIASVGKALSSLSMEVFLLAVRQFIKIDRIVRFDLDEHYAWEPMFMKINSSIF